jgi:ParB-like chromosome segregation protein Spo0J
MESSNAITDDEPLASNHCYSSMSAIEQLPELNVPVGSLVPGFYLREAGTNAVHVQMLAEVAGSIKLPPIIVQENGTRVIDGMHRLAAAKLRREKDISARVINCTDEEAIVLAIKSNTLHGLPLSRTDRISGAKRVLAAHPDWSDRAVAEVTGLSAKTIAVLRNRSTDGIPLSNKRLGRDGKRRPVRGAEGRRRAVDYINAHPDASLRQVAREADVSLGTVHDVRERIRRGTDPTAARSGSSSGQPPGTSAAATAPDRSSSANSTSSQTTGRNAQQLAWPAISSKLANDPTLRYTEGGRAFLRWMALHAMNAEEWAEFIDAIPAHWLRDIGLIADTISAEWRMFADRLRNKNQ